MKGNLSGAIRIECWARLCSFINNIVYSNRLGCEEYRRICFNLEDFGNFENLVTICLITSLKCDMQRRQIV